MYEIYDLFAKQISILTNAILFFLFFFSSVPYRQPAVLDGIHQKMKSFVKSTKIYRTW